MKSSEAYTRTVLILAVIMVAIMVVTASMAFARITRDADTKGGGGNPQGGGQGLIIECENPSGGEPPGQNDPDRC